jgi:hypothetical protein
MPVQLYARALVLNMITYFKTSCRQAARSSILSLVRYW